MSDDGFVFQWRRHNRVLRAGALGWPWGMTLRGGRGKGGFRMGTHVHLWLIHVNVWQEPLQYCKIIRLQLKLINLQKKKEDIEIFPRKGRSLGNRLGLEPCENSGQKTMADTAFLCWQGWGPASRPQDPTSLRLPNSHCPSSDSSLAAPGTNSSFAPPRGFCYWIIIANRESSTPMGFSWDRKIWQKLHLSS